jgi:hypothetical protein
MPNFRDLVLREHLPSVRWDEREASGVEHGAVDADAQVAAVAD